MIGGSIGCVIRWILSVHLNAPFPSLLPGTLVVNLVDGFIIDIVLTFSVRQPHLDPTWKFLITTGLCGGMTTFSIFSAGVVALLQNDSYAWAIISVLTHVTGSLLMAAAGFFIMALL